MNNNNEAGRVDQRQEFHLNPQGDGLNSNNELLNNDPQRID